MVRFLLDVLAGFLAAVLLVNVPVGKKARARLTEEGSSFRNVFTRS